MRTKRDRATAEDELLQRVVTTLEAPDTVKASWPFYVDALLDLLGHGPLICRANDLDSFDERKALDVRAELLGFLRSVATGAVLERESYGGICLYDLVTFKAQVSLDGLRMMSIAEGASRDLMVLQVMTIFDRIGLGRVRRCLGCATVFVRTGKREYCTTRCQDNAKHRRKRAEARFKKLLAQEAAARVRAKRERRSSYQRMVRKSS